MDKLRLKVANALRNVEIECGITTINGIGGEKPPYSIDYASPHMREIYLKQADAAIECIKSGRES